MRQKIELALRQPTTFTAKTMAELIERISEFNKIPVRIDEKELSAQGITGETELTAAFKDATLSTALHVTLKEIDGVPLAYFIHNDILWISTLEKADAALQTKLYDVRCLGFQDPERLIEFIMNETNGKWRDLGGTDTDGTISPWAGALVIRQTQSVHVEIEGVLDWLAGHIATF